MKCLNNRSLENIKKRFDIYDKILTNSKNKILSYTFLKEYIGFSITDDMIKYILSSTKFYEILTVFKNIFPYIDFDKENERIIYKNNKKPKRIQYIILYSIFLLPLILFIAFFKTLIQLPEYWITSVVLIILFAPVVIFFFREIGDRTLAINLMKKIEEEKKSPNAVYSQSEKQ
jgi:hypothetical protein